MDAAGSWRYGNDFARNVVICGTDNSSSFHTDNSKNSFLKSGEVPDNARAADKRFSINFTKTKTKFCLSLHYNGDSRYLLDNREKIYKFKADNKNVDSLTQFCLGGIFEKYMSS